MKRIFLIIALVSILFTACEKNVEPIFEISPDKEIVFTADGGYETVKIITNLKTWSVSSRKADAWYSYNTDTKYLRITVLPNETFDERRAELTVTAGEKLKKSINILQSAAVQKSYAVPKVRTHSVTNITENSAVSGVTMINDNGLPTLQYGICWATTPKPDTTSENTLTKSVSDAYGDSIVWNNIAMNNLQSNTTYYVRAFAINGKGVGYGEDRTFTTKQSSPPINTGQITISTELPTSVTETTATLNGSITISGNTTYTQKGFVYGKTSNPTMQNASTVYVVGTGVGKYSVNISGLTANTTYYVKAFIQSSSGINYGTEKTFTTDKILPLVATQEVTDITHNSALLHGSIINAGVPGYTERGFVYGTAQNPTTSNNNKVIVSGNGIGSYSKSISGLNANINYYVRAYAVNSKGTAYGEERNFIPQGTVVSTLAGNGSRGFVDGNGSSARFNKPTNVAVDAAGYIYVADYSNHCIRKITPSGSVSTLAGNGTAGFVDGIGSSARFYSPYGIAVDANGNVYVSESVHRIRKVTPSGVVTTLAGSGNNGLTDGAGSSAQFFYPSGIAVDTNGNVYVADRENHCIRKVTPDGVVSTLAGSGIAGVVDGVGSSARFYFPQSVAVDASGNVFVADGNNHRIRKVTPSGAVSTFAGNGTAGFADGSVSSAKFNEPYGITVDTAGNVYVADCKNHRIRKITPSGIVSTVAGNGTAGFADDVGSSAKFYNPYGVTIDAAGNVYVADYENQRIRKITFK